MVRMVRTYPNENKCPAKHGLLSSDAMLGFPVPRCSDPWPVLKSSRTGEKVTHLQCGSVPSGAVSRSTPAGLRDSRARMDVLFRSRREASLSAQSLFWGDWVGQMPPEPLLNFEPHQLTFDSCSPNPPLVVTREVRWVSLSPSG